MCLFIACMYARAKEETRVRVCMRAYTDAWLFRVRVYVCACMWVEGVLMSKFTKKWMQG